MNKKACIFQMTPGYWYPIPGFNGYEIDSNDVVRSFKNFKKYPYGYILKWYNNKPYTWCLTNNSNERVVITLAEIHAIIVDYKYPIQPRMPYDIDIGSRNRILEHPKPKKKFSDETFYPKFTIHG